MTYHFNFIWGSHGNDTIHGTHGNDVIFGGSGNDVIFGGNGRDVIYAGSGDDFIIGGFGLDYIDGGSGNDTISWDNLSSGLFVDLASQRVSFNAGGGEHFRSIENIVGSRGNDVIKGDRQRNVLSGNAGNDRLFGRGGDDILSGDAGHDVLSGGSGNDQLNGGEGNDRLIGNGSGFDQLDGGSGFDTADYSRIGKMITLKVGGIVNKGVMGSDGVDTTSQIEKFVGDRSQNNNIDGRSANDQISIAVDLGQNSLVVRDASGSGDRSYVVKNFNTLTGSAQADDLRGGDNNLTDLSIAGLAGDDNIRGGAGDDRLFGGADNDVIVGGDGNDLMFGGSGSDELISLRGSDELNGTDAESAGSHELDLLTGGLDSDRFILGDAQQAYYVANGFDDYAGILDFSIGEDVIVLHGSVGDYALNVDEAKGETEISYRGDRVGIVAGEGVTQLTLHSSSFEFV